MKSLILLVAVVLVGCGKSKEGAQGPSSPEPATPPQATLPTEPQPTPKEKVTPTKLVKELTLREKVVGEYEHKQGGDTIKGVFLENGMHEVYTNGTKAEIEPKWKISKDGELHIEYLGNFVVIRINPDGSLTKIAYIYNGKRIEAPKEEQFTAKKIK